MELELDCTWNEGKNKEKQIIHFNYKPYSLFEMPDEEIAALQKSCRAPHLQGPSLLEELAEVTKKYPKSLYALLMYHQSLKFFEFTDDADECRVSIDKKFSKQVFVKCMAAEEYIKEKRYNEFTSLFGGIEVLKGAFPQRKHFYYEEAMCFHSMWGQYFYQTGNEEQSQKHAKLLAMIANMAKSFQVLA